MEDLLMEFFEELGYDEEQCEEFAEMLLKKMENRNIDIIEN